MLRSEYELEPWQEKREFDRQLNQVNLAPLKGVIDSDPMRSKVLRLMIDDGGWVTTGDVLRAARKVRPIVGAVTIGTILNGLNDLVSSKLILSRTSLNSGIDWAEWRINPDLLESLRKLLQMLARPRLFQDRNRTSRHTETTLEESVTKVLLENE